MTVQPGAEIHQVGSTWFFLIFIGALERVCARSPWFGRLYHRLFYRRLVEKEAALAGLRPGERVLLVGAGSFPFTALQLAQSGHTVRAVDNDPRAVMDARRVVAAWNLADHIEVLQAEGAEISAVDADVIWVALHVHPKKKVIKKLLDTMPESGRVIYRNPRGVLRHLYPWIDPEMVAPGTATVTTDQIVRKESVLITRREETVRTAAGRKGLQEQPS